MQQARLGTEKRKCVTVWRGDPQKIFGRRGFSGKASGRGCESGTGTDGERDRNLSDGDVEQSDPRESNVDVWVVGNGVVWAGL